MSNSSLAPSQEIRYLWLYSTPKVTSPTAAPTATQNRTQNSWFVTADNTVSYLPNSTRMNAPESPGKTIADAITPETRGVVVVHIGGVVSPEMPEIARVCKERGVFLFEDAAHAVFTRVTAGGEERMCGTWGLCGAFSLFSNKNLTGGEGGGQGGGDVAIDAAHHALGRLGPASVQELHLVAAAQVDSTVAPGRELALDVELEVAEVRRRDQVATGLPAREHGVVDAPAWGLAWVSGLRVDERARVTDSSQRVVRIRFAPPSPAQSPRLQDATLCRP